MYPYSVYESDRDPLLLDVKSTIPVTCQGQDDSGQPTDCQLAFTIVANDWIAVRQHYPGVSYAPPCQYVIGDGDWNQNESRAYNPNAPLEVRARVDLLTTSPRLNQVYFETSVTVPRTKTVNGLTYPHPWFNYTIRVAFVSCI